MLLLKVVFLFCFVSSFSDTKEGGASYGETSVKSSSQGEILQGASVSKSEAFVEPSQAEILQSSSVSKSEISVKPSSSPQERNGSQAGKVNYFKKSANPAPQKTFLKAQKKRLSKKETPSKKSDLDYLVEKLEYLHSTLPANHKAIKAVQLRLAHIMSLKAEKNFMKVEKESCKACRKIAEVSAKRALRIYRSLDSNIKSAYPLLHTKSLFRQAYLYRFLGERQKSLLELKKIVLKDKIDSSLKVRAWFSIGELYFENYNYKKALQSFNKVLKVSSSPWFFKASYRKIWSLSNLSLYESSLHHLESFLNSDLYAQSGNQELKEKLEKELIHLYSYGKITKKRLIFLYTFLKQDSKKNSLIERQKRLFDFAQALSRVGRITESNVVWQFYISQQPPVERQLQAYSFMIANDLILSSSSFLEDIEKKIKRVFTLLPKAKVSENFKLTFKRKIKVFFGKIKTSKLSEKRKREMLFLYQKYSSFYPKDIGVLSQTAYLARDLKKYSLAGSLFQKLALNIEVQESAQKDQKENMSFLQMEMAELSKEEKNRMQSYDFYIQHGRSKAMLFKAQYQKAYIHYENKEYQKTSKEFERLALLKIKGANKEIYELRLKAAHLSLSSLVYLKDPEEEFIRLTGLFLKEFSNEKSEFIRIRHTALLNRVKKLLSNKDFSHRPTKPSSDKDILKAWKILKLFSVKDANREEAFIYHFNRLLIAKELLNFEIMKQSFQTLLNYKSLSKKDRDIILKWKLWLAELQFDFKEVLKVVKTLQKGESSEERILRLARLSELAGESPIEYYQLFIKKFPQSPSLRTVFTSLMEQSPLKQQKAFLKKYAALFKSQPERLVQLILKTDKGRLEEDFFKSFTSLDFMKNSSLASFLKKKESIETFEQKLKPTAQYTLPKNFTGRRLTKAIKRYSEKLEDLGTVSQKILKVEDWTVRVFVLFYWEREISRFYSSIIGLPFPKGLNKEEKRNYSLLVKNQLQSYKDQAINLNQEWQKLWARDFLSDYEKSFQKGGAFYALLKWEIEKIALIADKERKRQLNILLSSFKSPEMEKEIKTAESNQIQSLYKSLKQNPFDKKSLIQLLDIEKQRKNEAMSYYLAGRIKNLNKGRRWRL